MTTGNTPFNYPILNSCSLKTVSSIDVYLNLDDCILHYSPMCSLNFVHIVHIVPLTLHFILFCVIDSMFYYCTRYCNSVRMTCLIKRLLILSYLSFTTCTAYVERIFSASGLLYSGRRNVQLSRDERLHQTQTVVQETSCPR